MLAWKLNSKGLVVDVVVILNGVVGGSRGVNRKERGEETINIMQTNATHMHGMANAMLTVF